MIDKKQIEKLVKEGLEEAMFLVNINVSKSNVINVYIDGHKGITIEQCVAMSRKIESALDRDKEDFELVVSSAGLGQPFKVREQYLKNIGNDIEVVSLEGEKVKGKLKEVDEKGISLVSTKKVKVEGKKKKQRVEETIHLGFDNIKSAKTIISF